MAVHHVVGVHGIRACLRVELHVDALGSGAVLGRKVLPGERLEPPLRACGVRGSRGLGDAARLRRLDGLPHRLHAEPRELVRQALAGVVGAARVARLLASRGQLERDVPGARLGVGARVVGVEAQHALKVQGPLVGPQRGGLPEGEGRLGVRRGGRQERHNLPLLGDALRSQQRRKHRLGVARPKELAGQGARILFAQCTGALGVARDARIGPVGADVGREHQAHLRAVQVLDAHLGPVLAAPVRQRRGVQSLHRGHQRVLRLGVQVDGPAGHAVLDDVGVGG